MKRPRIVLKGLNPPDRIESDVVANEEADELPELQDETEKSEKLAKVVANIIAQEFSGPIPPPDIIAGYDNVVPGAADRIIKMAEQQSSHRQAIQMIET